MTKRQFCRKLALFFLPLAMVFALPLAVLLKSSEIMPVSMLASAHAKASSHALYGPAYSNPDKGFKMAGLRLRQTPIVAIGSSRVMQFRSDFFRDKEEAFYNGGGTITRLWDYRPLFKRLRETKTRRIILGFDQWAFNPAWVEYAPDPDVGAKYDGNYSTLDTIQRSLKVYPDIRSGRLSLSKLFSPTDSFGVNGITHQNGFERDGSYLYSDLRRARLETGEFRDDDCFERIRTGTSKFEPGDRISEDSLLELRMLLDQITRDGFEVVAFTPPYAPSVLETMRQTGQLGYVFKMGDKIRPILNEYHVHFVDLTSCDLLDCRDADFIDGFHAGSFMYAKIAVALSKSAYWLADALDEASLNRRFAQSHEAWELPYD